MGDLKVFWGKIVGKAEMEEIFGAAGLPQCVGTQVHDGDIFNRYRNVLWTAVRQQYPARIQPDSIVISPIKDDESPQAYVHNTRKEWIRQTGARPDQDVFHNVALRKIIADGLPTAAQSRLNEAVGLYTVTFNQFTDHVVDAVMKTRANIQKVDAAAINRR